MYDNQVKYKKLNEIVRLVNDSEISSIRSIVSGIIKIINDPNSTANDLKDLIENGLEKRLMFGSDAMQWPETIELAIEAIETADFLTEDQRRDIFYNNASRFFRLSDEEIKQHHGN